MTALGVQVTEPPGKVIKPNSWKSIQDEGMPVHGRPYEKGNLYIHFKMVFPEELSQEQVSALRSILPGPTGAAGAALNGSMDVDSEQVRACLSGRLSGFLSRGAGAVRPAVQSPRVSMECGPDVEQVILPGRSSRILPRTIHGSCIAG